MTEGWRECPFATDIRERRFCPIRSESSHSRAEITPEVCTTCPVPEQKRKADLWDKCGPALVKAVRELHKRAGAHLQTGWTPAAWHDQVVVVDAEIRGFYVLADAALALLPEETPCQPE